VRTRLLAAGLSTLAAAVAAAQTPAGPARPGPAADGRPAALRDVGFDQRLGETLPLDAPLRDEAGREVRLGDYFGRRPVVLSLVYYECPMLCTLTLNGLVSALGVLSFQPGREFEIVTVSFDPKDTPDSAAARKRAYLARYGRPAAAAGWHFLTGSTESIERITRALGFRYAWDAQTSQFAHPAGIVVATPEGRLARYLYGIEYAPRDLQLAVTEASAGKVGGPVEQVLLFCYEYDPASGGYGLAIMRLVRAAGVLTVAALAGYVLLMLRRERALAAAAVAGARGAAGRG
jgi:protein SCO1/2